MTSVCRRSEYTIGEDVAIIQAVLLESKYHSVNGNKLWQMLAARKVDNCNP